MTHHTSANLTAHRTPVSVWDRRGWDGTREHLTMMRWLVGMGGAALAVQGVRQRSLTGGLLAGLGGSLAWWALTGEGDLSEVGRWCAHMVRRAGWDGDGRVEEASADSFPASDPPSWTPTVGSGVISREGRAH